MGTATDAFDHEHDTVEVDRFVWDHDPGKETVVEECTADGCDWRRWRTADRPQLGDFA